MVRIKILTTQDENRVRKFLDNYDNALAQHTLEWKEIIKEQETDKDYYLIAKNKERIVGVLPLFLYENPLGNILQSIPYPGGYGGILALPENREEIFKKLCKYAIDLAKKNKCVTLTICTPPFDDPQNLDLYKKYFQPDFERENFYQYIDLKNQLSDNPDDFRNKIRENLRRNLKKAEKQNLQLFFDDNQNIFDQWYKIYQKRMAEIDSYVIPYKFFSSIRKNLINSKKYQLITAFKNDRLICGTLYVGNKKVVDDFMPAIDSDYKDYQGNVLLVWKSLKYFKNLDFKYFNWESSPAMDSVYHFKKGWKSQEDVHFYLTKVISDLTQIKKSSIDKLREIYKWHYVFPYSTPKKLNNLI